MPIECCSDWHAENQINRLCPELLMEYFIYYTQSYIVAEFSQVSAMFSVLQIKFSLFHMQVQYLWVKK